MSSLFARKRNLSPEMLTLPAFCIPAEESAKLHAKREAQLEWMRTKGVQYILGNEVVVLLWQPVVRFGQPPLPVRLKALDPHTQYSSGTAVHEGAVLLHHGLIPTLPSGDYASTMIHLTAVTPS